MAGRLISPDINELVTLRDWLRWGVTAFNGAGLRYGHGTSNAQDEAAFLILKTLDLPVDALAPWLDCRLTHDERARVLSILERRITSRTPASYIVNEAWIGGYGFYVDERVIVPRALIGELLAGGLKSVVADSQGVTRVLDMCTGSGCLAVLSAFAFRNAMVDAVDVSREALAVAKRNVADYGLGGRIRLVASDLFSELASERYDLIISNPPYVSAEAMAQFPPEHRAEPAIAHAGGNDGLDIVRAILKAAPDHLNDGGQLVVEVGTGRTLLESEYPGLPFLWLDTEETEGEVFAISKEEITSTLPPARRTRARKGAKP